MQKSKILKNKDMSQGVWISVLIWYCDYVIVCLCFSVPMW